MGFSADDTVSRADKSAISSRSCGAGDRRGEGFFIRVPPWCPQGANLKCGDAVGIDHVCASMESEPRGSGRCLWSSFTVNRATDLAPTTYAFERPTYDSVSQT